MISHNCSKKSNGFTLIEVAIATFVVAIALVALANTVQSITKNQGELRTKFVANLIANNKLAELQFVSPWPEVGESDDDVEMANQEWFIEIEVIETDVESLRRVDISVGLDNDVKAYEATLSGFISSESQLNAQPINWQASNQSFNDPNSDDTDAPQSDDETNSDQSEPTRIKRN